MPLLFEKSFDKLQGESINELLTETDISRTSPGAKAKTLLSIVNRKVNKAYQEFDINFLRSFLPFAQGQFLDYLGDMLGVARLGARRATVSSADQVVKFYVETGTFGDINNNQDIVIPSNQTLISTGSGISGVVFKLSVGVILDRTLTEYYVPIEAVKDGSISNVGANTLNHHNFNNYTAAAGLLVTNTAGIESGTKVENDTNYRFRIANQVLASERANETAVRLSLLTVPGVSNLIYKNFAKGIGTFEVIIQTVVPNTPDSVIAACQTSISRVQAQGIFGQAVKPILTGLTFETQITWRADTTTAMRQEIKQRAIANLTDYINNIPIGEGFFLNEAIERVMATDNRILTIGAALRPFDNVSIFKQTKLQDNKVREELIGDYTAKYNERLIIEPSIPNPILLGDAN